MVLVATMDTVVDFKTMNRIPLFNYINERLATHAVQINTSGKLNQLGPHNHSEFLYEHFLNKLYGWKLRNINKRKSNVESIDLIEDDKKFVVQVSAVCTKQKIESSLAGSTIKNYTNYRFKFVAISRDATELRKQSFNNPHGLTFDPKDDIYDTASILGDIQALDIDTFNEIYQLIKKELGSEPDITRLDSDLTKTINILASTTPEPVDNPTVDDFEIERKIAFNNLDSAREVVNDFSAHSPRLDKIYAVFDSQGKNISNAVLSTFKSEYLRNKDKTSRPDDLFFLIIDNIKNYILRSPNLDSTMSMENLDLCVNIVVVDAFIKCKIFENPNNYKYANT